MATYKKFFGISKDGKDEAINDLKDDIVVFLKVHKDRGTLNEYVHLLF